jgi:hypothetical protein
MANRVYVAAVSLLLAGVSSPAVAVKPVPKQNALAGISQCRSIGTDAERLACYDKEMATLDQAVARDDITVVDKDDVKRVRRSLFGFTLPNLSALGFAKDDDKTPEASDLDSTITAVHAAGYGHWEFQIAEGNAVWRNTDVLEDRPASGAPVHFRKATLGAYFVKIDGGRAFRAVRVR